ncbi:MAG TPA: acyltransferase [Anaerolineales bacterium]
MKKINNIQSLRGFAVLFVVFFHLFIVENKYSGFDTLLPATLQFGTFGVDLFFVISGFVMVTVTRGKFQNIKQSLRFLYHRLTRIYPLYWIYTLMALAVFLVQPAWVNSSQGNQISILESFLLLPSNILPLVQVGWTLIHEVYFYLVYFLVFLLIPESLLVYAIGGWGLIVVMANIAIKVWNPYLSLIFSPLTIEFLSGCLLAVVYYRREGSKFNLLTLIGAAVLILILALVAYEYYRTSTGQVAPLDWWRVLLYGLPAWMITYCLLYAERTGFIFHPSIARIGDASYSIYLSHLFTINVVGRVWAIFSVDGWFDNIFFVLITFAVVLLAGFLSYSMVENKLLGLSRKLIDL